MELTIWNYRRNLNRTVKKLMGGKLTIGFIGGSITDARPRHNWPEPVISWFIESFPQARIAVENAAIGATGSDLAVFRAQRDLIDRGCDLIFIEFAVNDNGEPPEKRMRSREGLIRKLLKNGDRDLLFTYTFSKDMLEDMMASKVPPSIGEFEQLADHYGVGSIWMGLYALEEVKKGRMRFEEWLPDGLHPTSRGSLSYAQSVIKFLEAEIKREHDSKWNDIRESAALNPLNPRNWENAENLSLEDLQTEGPWTLRRWPYYEWIDRVLETAAIGAKLSFIFEGRGLSLGFDFGKSSADFRYRLDDGVWLKAGRDIPDWVGDDGWYRLWFLGDDLSFGKHRFELEVIPSVEPANTGTNFRLANIGIIK